MKFKPFSIVRKLNGNDCQSPFTFELAYAVDIFMMSDLFLQ